MVLGNVTRLRVVLMSRVMAEGVAGASAGVTVVIENELPVDDDVLDADVVLERFGVGRLVEDAGGVEECDVSERSDLQSASIAWKSSTLVS